MGRFGGAIRETDKAIELNPKGSFGYYVKAGVYRETDQIAKALETINKKISYQRDAIRSKANNSPLKKLIFPIQHFPSASSRKADRRTILPIKL